MTYNEARHGIDAVERRRYIRTARQLGYPEDVILQIKNATSEIQCDRIMMDARKRY